MFIGLREQSPDDPRGRRPSSSRSRCLDDARTAPAAIGAAARAEPRLTPPLQQSPAAACSLGEFRASLRAPRHPPVAAFAPRRGWGAGWGGAKAALPLPGSRSPAAAAAAPIIRQTSRPSRTTPPRPRTPSISNPAPRRARLPPHCQRHRPRAAAGRAPAIRPRARAGRHQPPPDPPPPEVVVHRHEELRHVRHPPAETGSAPPAPPPARRSPRRCCALPRPRRTAPRTSRSPVNGSRSVPWRTPGRFASSVSPATSSSRVARISIGLSSRMAAPPFTPA